MSKKRFIVVTSVAVVSLVAAWLCGYEFNHRSAEVSTWFILTVGTMVAAFIWMKILNE